MSEPRGAMSMPFPKPGKVLRGVLIAVFGLAIFWAVAHWFSWGAPAFSLLVFVPRLFLHGEVWRIFTAGLLVPPGGPGAVSHLFFTLLGLYFLSPDLEKRWGGKRFGIFLAASVIGGYLLALLVDLLPIPGEMLHPGAMYGLSAAITGTAVAWSVENANLEVRLFFVVPVKGRHLLWITVGYCILSVIFGDTSTEGVIAPFGGIAAGLLFAGSPSPLRAAYLNWKLASLRKKSGGLSAAAMLQPTATKRRSGGPPLRIVQGGLDDDSPKREPPRDKRFLN